MKIATTVYDKLVAKKFKFSQKMLKKAISRKTKSSTIPNKMHKCKKCNEGFISRWYLLKHKCCGDEMEESIIETKEPEVEKQKKDLKCPKCIGIAFPSEAALKHHKILHSGFKPYSCIVCNITFESEEKWRNHIDQSAKQSHCDECFQYFGCLIAKQRHVCLESSYCCTYCGAQFKKILAFDRHKERCKLKMDCQICGRKFVKRGAFIIHMKQMHDIPVSHDIVSSTPQPVKEAPNIFTTIDNFIKQGQERQDSEFTTEIIHLNGPVKMVGMCSVTSSPNGNNPSDNLPPDTNKQSKEKGFNNECDICHRMFRNARALQVHQRIHRITIDENDVNDMNDSLSEDIEQEEWTSHFKSMCETCNEMMKFDKQNEECVVCQGLTCTCEKSCYKFVCTKCNGEYKKTVNDELICKDCHEVFDTETIFNEHVKSHNILGSIDQDSVKTVIRSTVKRIFKCSKCKCSLKSLAAMKRHKRTYHTRKRNKITGGQKICCLQCEKVLPNKLAFDLHLKICGTNEAGEDLENNELKRLKSTLNESALLNSSGNTSIECNKCMKIFRTPKHLEMHDKQVHKDYQCKVCNLMFWKSDDLLNHLRVHTSVKQYKCDYCEASLGSSMKLRFHRVTHFGTAYTVDDNGSPAMWYRCEHCNTSFDSFRKFELHCKRFAIGPDGKIKVLPKKARNRNAIKKLRIDVFAGVHVVTCYNCQETFEDEESLKEHKATCMIKNINENAEIQMEQTQIENVNNEIESQDAADYQTSPSVFESDIQYDEEEGEGGENFVEEEQWMSRLQDENDSDSVFESTIDLIESARRDEPITSGSNLVFLAVKAMDICIRSRGLKRATTRVRKIIKDVFKLLVDHPVTIERPHSCLVCGKLFIHPQGITNHYYQKHGSRGILHSLSLVKTVKEFPEKGAEKKTRRKRKLDPTATEADGDVIGCRQVENNVSPKDEPVLIELRNNISKLLCHLVSDNEVLAELGWPKRLIDDVLIDVISRCESRPCLDARKSRLSRLRENITTLLSICVKEQAMENFGWNSKPVDEVVKEMLAGGEIASA